MLLCVSYAKNWTRGASGLAGGGGGGVLGRLALSISALNSLRLAFNESKPCINVLKLDCGCGGIIQYRKRCECLYVQCER